MNLNNLPKSGPPPSPWPLIFLAVLFFLVALICWHYRIPTNFDRSAELITTD
jgi:hypothetical protein